MKIAHIICVYPPDYQGGMGNSVAGYVKELVKLCREVQVMTPAYNKQERHEDRQGVKIWRVKPFFSFGLAAYLPKIIKELPNFDIVHLHYPFFGTAELVAVAKLLAPKKIRLVLHYHMDSYGYGFKGLIFSLYRLIWLPLLLRLADSITCASLDYAKHSAIGAYYVKHRAKFVQVPFGVDTERFHPGGEVVDNKILFVGGLDKQHYFKGVAKLIESMVLVRQKLPTAKLNIVGRGELVEEYKDLAEKLNLTTAITFITDADDEALVKYYQDCSVLVLPSLDKSEAFGLVLLEAMASAKPVIASNLPGVRSVFKNGKQGLTVRPGDSKDLAEKILYILNNEAKAQKMGEAARRLAEQRYSWQVAAVKLNEVYSRLRFAPKVKNHNHK